MPAHRSGVSGNSANRHFGLAKDPLLATDHIVGFIRDHLREEFPALRSIVKRMLRSSEPTVCETGARLASIAAMLHLEARTLGNQALRGRPALRIGVAAVASDNLGVSEFRAWCETRLLKLFDDYDDEVRQRASLCFDQLPADSIETFTETNRSVLCQQGIRRRCVSGLFNRLRNLAVASQG